jgi:hypothetical protein
VLDWYGDRNRDVVRETLRKISVSRDTVDRAAIDSAIKWFNRIGDYDSLRSFAIQRFATYLTKTNITNPEGTNSVNWGFRTGMTSAIRAEAAAAIDAGHVEIINTGIGSKIIQSISTLFTEDDSYIRFVSPSQNDNVNEVESIMSEVWSAGGRQTILVQLDQMSCMVESAFVHVFFKGNELRWDVVSPSAVWIKFGSRLIYRDMNGEETSGWVDYSDIDDASAVIIRTEIGKGVYDSSPDESQWQAYVGACKDWPDGRNVVYRARKPWPIPDLGSAKIDYEHMPDGKPCNQLTWIMHYGSETERAMVLTEYPVVLWRGGLQVEAQCYPPTTTSLYQSCFEIEMAWSRLLGYALKGARGVDLFQMATGNIRVPESLDVPVIGDGDTYQKTGWPASNSRDAANVVGIISEQMAMGFNAPGYNIVGMLNGMQPASGIALVIQSEPTIRFRKHRYNINKAAMRRLWWIERAMLAYKYPKDMNILTVDMSQEWNAGTWKIPVTDLEDAQATTTKLDNGTWDLVDGVRHTHRLSTDSEAEQKIEEMRGRDPGYAGAAPVSSGSKFGAGNG